MTADKPHPTQITFHELASLLAHERALALLPERLRPYHSHPNYSLWLIAIQRQRINCQIESALDQLALGD